MNPADYENVFKLPFAEASQFFRDKLNIPTEEWDELEGAALAKGFTSAGAHNSDLLSDLRKMTDAAIDGKVDIKEFRKQFIPLVEKYGWQLKGGGPGWRSNLIFRTNIATSYQAGRWEQFKKGGIDYLKYVHSDGVMNPRPNHKAMDGVVLPISDPFWTANYPPNGWGCKCRAVAATKRDYESAGPGQTKRPDGWEELADDGWRYNVGQAGEAEGYKALTDKLETLPNEISRAWMKRFVKEPAFVRFIDGKIAGEFPVAVLDEAAMSAIDTDAQVAWFSSDSLSKNKGLQPSRSKGHPELTLEDYRLLPDVIGHPQLVIEEKGTQEVFIRREGVLYMAVLKTTKSRKRLFVTSFRRTTLSDVDRKRKTGNVIFDELK